ncbi:S53 family peptidase [Amnibacterium kyonggiense]
MTDSSGSDPQTWSLLPGSERRPAPGARAAARDLGGDERVEATLVLRRPAEPDAEGDVMTPAAFAERYAASEQDVDAVRSALGPLGVEVLSVHRPSRRVRVGGTVAAMQRAFGTSLRAVTSAAPDGGRIEHRERTGPLQVPAPLDGVVTAVLGLDDRPQARTQSRVASAAVGVSYTPLQLGTLYDFPEGTDGSGRTVAIVELGGGFAQSDLDAYFQGLGIASPTVTAVPVDGGDNVPGGDPNGADGEVLLDIEVVGALAPAADVLVYFAPNTDAGFLDAVADAAHATPTPVAISISWGQSEDEWTAQARTALDDAIRDAAVLGVTVTAAAGDNGSSDGATDGSPHADFPASSPHALACGGTSLRATGGTVQSETVWNDGAQGGATGGGVSRAFPLPSWQRSADVPAAPAAGGGRGVPDVAGDADPETGYQVLIDGKQTVIGGTSAVAPLWAALTARLAQALDAPLGLLQPKLYGAPDAFRDITVGDNGAYRARAGWDACTGLGSPRGTALLAALRQQPTAPAASD